MKKVCILTSVHNALDVRIFHKQARTLSEHGYDVTLIGQHSRPETISGIRVMPVRRPRSRLLRMLGTLRLLLLGLRRDADIYHFHDPELIPVGLALKLLGRKVVYDVHEDYGTSILSKGWLPNSARRLVARAFSCVEALSSRLFDAVITVDSNIAGKFSGRIVVIANYPRVDMSGHVGPNDGSASVNLGRAFTCIYAGGLGRNRGVCQMVKALEHISFPVKLVLLGQFENDEIRKEVTALPGFVNVDYRGVRPWSEAIKSVSTSDAGLIMFQPTLAHMNVTTGNNKFFEYMMAGIPIVSADFPGLRKMIEENDCGIAVDPTRPQEIARAIEYLHNHRDVARKMGKNGRKAFLKKYNWELQEKKLLQLYGYLAGNRNR
jgi:glycosyltransferase involved in cell wall biosynthesis